MKKPFKETKVGKWLAEKAPNVLHTVGDILPDRGALGIAKRLLMSSSVSEETKQEFLKLEQEFELECFELEAKDRDSARTREAEFVKATGHVDWMMTTTGILVMLSFIGMVAVLIFKEIPVKNEHIMINALGIMEGLVLSVIGYYFGSSVKRN